MTIPIRNTPLTYILGKKGRVAELVVDLLDFFLLGDFVVCKKGLWL